MKPGYLLIGAIVLALVGLGVILGGNISDQAMAVVVGTICGISASIPVSIGLVLASIQHKPSEPAQPTQPTRSPIVIIQRLNQGDLHRVWSAQNQPLLESREFKIIGDE